MENALDILRTMLGRRGLDTKTERILTDDLDKAELRTIGKVLVVFSQKDKLLERDITGFMTFANANEYTTGVIIVALSPPSDNVRKTIKNLAKDRVQLFHIRELQFDITTHRMAVPHRILEKEEERNAVFKKYNITKPELQLPKIDSQDTMARWVGAVPGDVLEVIRHSDVAGRGTYYRYCVADADVNVA
jgi:DNA-directed RNA polymerase subunit H (RpoH/RPB5)